jgi:hypothetical protein
VTPANPAVSATAAPASASVSRPPSEATRNCCMSDSSRNHSDTNPAVGGSPARVSEPTARPAPLHGARRAMPRSASRSSLPATASRPAAELNSSDLATVCITICRVAASRPMATSRWLPTAAPVSATPNPVMISPLFSTLE